jgi:hypothetical protein
MKHISYLCIGYSHDYQVAYFENVYADDDGTKHLVYRAVSNGAVVHETNTPPAIDIPVEYQEPSGL